MWKSLAEKGRVNAEFVLAAILGLDVEKPAIILLQPAYQLAVEGLELVLKAMMLKQGADPHPTHQLETLYEQLTQADKSVVDDAVRSAIDESATGPVPFNLQNVAGVQLLKDFTLGVDTAEEDHTSGYAHMEPVEFLRMLDTEWGTDISQYVGVTRSFSIEKQTIRVDTRILAGSIRVLLTLAEHLLGPVVPAPERRSASRLAGWINSDGTWTGVPADHAVEKDGVLEIYLEGELVIAVPLGEKLGWQWRDATGRAVAGEEA